MCETKDLFSIIISPFSTNFRAASNYGTLTSHESPLESGPLTLSEGAMVVSLLCAGGLLGTIVSVMGVERYGSKMSLIFLAIPQIVTKSLLFHFGMLFNQFI